ncbi:MULTISPECIES: MarR family winged helix-turn-helix transcriptional regulator [unclassified Methanoregula]|uniref:MarR family winged helix-turn-helix transcriptional regulator n=1 Tax=unclassified Methanoregula TaxID=2649730 RepID=UPI0009CDDD06|nr:MULTISPECIES: MarR family winged helix-turn-helix transcriptional regulator [unclassified Methanoregula]OPX65276.1 MAG: MarR family protein [Methanoregula sp. PtaB.Bin085]OPY32185.1 MAG: MarR family protein [Methanoregula sp. PtaU1.Bin006]
MNEHNEHLLEALERLLMMKNECSCSIFSECGLSDMTVRQIAYLKAISGQGDVTFSRLAEITNNSKPTITEMVNRFVRMNCVYREPCRDDGRILYIRLTDKGKMVAGAEQAALRRVVERMVDSLDDHELETLIRILGKVR